MRLLSDRVPFSSRPWLECPNPSLVGRADFCPLALGRAIFWRPRPLPPLLVWQAGERLSARGLHFCHPEIASIDSQALIQFRSLSN